MRAVKHSRRPSAAERLAALVAAPFVLAWVGVTCGLPAIPRVARELWEVAR